MLISMKLYIYINLKINKLQKEISLSKQKKKMNKKNLHKTLKIRTYKIKNNSTSCDIFYNGIGDILNPKIILS